jgi:hypothetical protein
MCHQPDDQGNRARQASVQHGCPPGFRIALLTAINAKSKL